MLMVQLIGGSAINFSAQYYCNLPDRFSGNREFRYVQHGEKDRSKGDCLLYGTSEPRGGKACRTPICGKCSQGFSYCSSASDLRHWHWWNERHTARQKETPQKSCTLSSRKRRFEMRRRLLKRDAISEERKLEIKLNLITKRNPKNIKGFDSTVGAIIDADNNLVCLVPVTRMDWVYDCLTAKTKTDYLFTVLSRMTDDEVRLCTGCKRNAAEPREQPVSESKVVRFSPVRRKTPPLVS